MILLIRRLQPGDEVVVARVAADFKHADISPERAVRFLVNRDNYLFVAEVEHDVVGFVLAYRLERLDRAAAQLFIYEVDVRPAQRRQGIGRALMDTVRQAVRDEGMMEAFVFTSGTNAAAVKLYESTGAHIEDAAGLVCVYPGAAA